jgi:hypothetical protein
MISAHSEGFTTRGTSGTEDDDDDCNDEQPGENEAPSREADDQTEAPEEFAGDYESELSRPEAEAEAEADVEEEEPE